jgi:transporter family-2 protein
VDPAGLVDPMALAVSVGAGVCGAVQPEVNSVLGIRLGSGLLAALVNFAVALLCAVAVISRRPATRRWLLEVRGWPVPAWTRAAGLGGAIVVLSGVTTVEELGVAVFSVAFFAGQLSFGLVVDRIGLSPGGRRPVTLARFAAVVIALVAVVIAQLDRPVGDLEPILVAFVVAAGAASALQAAGNGRITVAIGDPVAATTLNVVVGTAALATVTVVTMLAGGIDSPDWPTEPWLYVGGALGVTIVLALAAATAAIGVLRTTLAMLAAQLVGAFVVDWVAGDEAPTVGVLVAGALMVVAVALVRRGAPTPAAS